MTSLPGFAPEEEIYRNQSTVVVRAIRLRDRLPVVIKYSANEYPTLKQTASFRNEFEILQGLQSRRIIRAYGLERMHNRMFLIEEDFGGAPLMQYFSTAEPTIEDFLEIAIAIVDGLIAVHERQIIHKDISPSNLLINAGTREVRIIDFGIAARLFSEERALKNPEDLEGTLAYISPEQTGRMNRTLDFRTDLYSLGASFYHLLGGTPPFEGGDALELVHSHLARPPRPLTQIDPGIPPVLSDIIAKLMSKALEDRYQSAIGLKHDLRHCLAQWRRERRILPFPLAARDLTTRFEVPNRLLGREKEIGILLEGLDRVARRGAELLLVGGYSGVGKSSLVREVHKPVVRQGGYFIAGKYDQFDCGVPYSALRQAFDQLVQTVLTEPAERVASWRSLVQKALGPNGRIMAEVIPSLEQLIGPQPPVPALNGAEAQRRFNLVFQNFALVFARPQHPLVLFVDDLQWADNSSLGFLEDLLCRSGISNLLIIAAYRDNEIDDQHPSMLTVQAIRKSKTAVSEMTILPLIPEDAEVLVAETLHSSPEQTAPLARLLYQKTGGNPFFFIQLLYSLRENRLLTVNPDSGEWSWDLKQLENTGITDNIVELMTTRIQRLPDRCKEILKKAACLGSRFDLKTLATISQMPVHLTAQKLWPALSEELIVPISGDYQSAHQICPEGDSPSGQGRLIRTEINEELSQKIESGQFNVNYRFLHDRVQQAAYLLIAESERKSEHLRIGRLLLAGTAESRLDEILFEIANHFNIGLDLVTDEAEKLTLARLNLRAGKRAKAAAANQAAVQHLSIAINLLGPGAWERHYELTFELHQVLAQCQCLIGNFQESDRLSMEAILRGRSALDKAPIYAMRIQLFIISSGFSKASQAGIEGLALMGFRVPSDGEEKSRACAAELARIEDRLKGIEVGTLIDLPAMNDPEKKAATDLLVHTWVTAYFAGNMVLSTLIIYWIVATSLEYGNTDASAIGYVLYGMLLTLKGDYRRGFDFGLLGKRLNEERFPNPIYTPKLSLMIANMLNPYFNHFETNLPYYLKSYTTSLQVGDLLCSLGAVHFMVLARTIKGDNLAEVSKEADKYLNLVESVRDRKIITAYALHRQLLLSLQGLTDGTGSLDTETFNEADHVDYLRGNNFQIGMAWYLVFKIGLQVQLGQFREALQTSRMAESSIAYDRGRWSTTNHFFYQSLALIKVYPGVAPAEKEAYDELLKRNLEKFRIWSELGPANFLHRYQLMLAEKARLEGRDSEAEDLYDLSIKNAVAGKFTHDEALALEFAAHFHLGKGRERIFQVYLTDSYYAYTRWGAVAKTRLLEREFGHLLLNTGGNSIAAVTGTASMASTTLTTGGGAQSLDLATVIKATQTISREIVQEKLLVKLMSILTENAGAERGILILERHGRLIVEAEAGTSHSVPLRRPLSDFQDLIRGVVNLVYRTRQSLVLDDANLDPRFINDDYLLRVRPKSVLCLPILNQGRLQGMVYFENNLSVSVFTCDRLTVLELLTSQAAISIENSSLYQELERRVEERTRELRAAQAELVATARQAGMAEIATNILHNVGNVLNSVNVSANLVCRKIHHSKAAGLSRAVGLMSEHAADLGDFLTRDDRGRQLPVYLEKLAAALTAEQQSIVEELGQLTGSINHIKEIVATQQSYAGPSSLVGPVDICELMKDALRMNAMAFARHEIAVTWETIEIPILLLDKHRVLLILINLISNAKYAMDEITDRPRRLTLAIELIEGRRLRIRVADNGIGIPAENLTRIFSHGFTTRKEGHGFGLHSCVLAAQEMNGQLTVHSDGLGKGTVFTLELPVNLEEPDGREKPT